MFLCRARRVQVAVALPRLRRPEVIFPPSIPWSTIVRQYTMGGSMKLNFDLE